jgi:hypothetical protein
MRCVDNHFCLSISLWFNIKDQTVCRIFMKLGKENFEGSRVSWGSHC